MASRTALVLETNPVITERYLDYTHDSDWRIMLKDSLNGFLEKLQHEKFNLIVAEESLLPQGIIQMMKATGIPFLLATNTKNPEIPTLPRNFNRTELLTVFDRLVPKIQDEQPAEEDAKKGENAVNELLSGLEDEEEAFELTSDAVVMEAKRPQKNQAELDLDTSSAEFFGEDNLFEEQNDDLFSDGNAGKPADLFGGQNKKSKEPKDLFGEGEKSEELEDLFGDITKPNDLFGKKDSEPEKNKENSDATASDLLKEETVESKQGTSFAPPSFDSLSAEKSDIDSFVNSLSLEKEIEKEEEYDPGEKTLGTAVETFANKTAISGNAADTNAIRAEVSAWLEKNARSIIKEIVLEQLESLSGKKND
jgi:hypothetical protein